MAQELGYPEPQHLHNKHCFTGDMQGGAKSIDPATSTCSQDSGAVVMRINIYVGTRCDILLNADSPHLSGACCSFEAISQHISSEQLMKP